MQVRELSFEEAVDFAGRHNTKLVWLGSEPVEYIRELLSLDEGTMVAASPEELISLDKKSAVSYKDHVFVCYHGNTSRYVASALKESFGVESVSMRGGVTAVVGEIF